MIPSDEEILRAIVDLGDDGFVPRHRLVVRFRGQGASEVLILLPMVTPEIIMGISLLIFFGQLFGQNGSLGQIAIAHITFCISYVAVVVRARARNMDPHLEEAARDLGASASGAFWHVTLPMLKPVLIASTAIDKITTVTTFDLVKIMTNGGPMRSTQTLAFYIWQEGFRDVNFGYGAAMSVVMLVTLCIATLFYLRVSRGSMRESDAAIAL